ncbi:hypothetical protein ASA1KI_08840 [Opitutales bacterium ASA1]|uniref:hypothetical protein n=1 Tax=Congregicoccus parvus TaxID=3081749 RepID=UPI002B28A906|nr:hypothetical protein ASA1KI_08840 [Opitutales bacterium ASA1]
MHAVSADSTAAPSVSVRRRHGWFWFSIALLVGGVACVSYVVLDLVAVGPSAVSVRQPIATALENESGWYPQVRVRLGAVPLFVARRVVSAIPDLPREALQGLRAVRGAEVTIMSHDGRSSPAARADSVVSATAALDRDGWEPVVAVRDGATVVRVFVRDVAVGGETLSVCVVVCEDGQLVVASARVETEPLVELVSTALREHGPRRVAGLRTGE